MEETVSVVIPTYKGANNLPRAIDSILNQTYRAVEIVIVDDNDPLSKERMETKKVVEKYKDEKIKYIQHERNKNGAAARNTGIFHSIGKYVCFLDDDDFYLEDRIQKSAAALEENPEYDAVYGGVIITNKNYIEGIIKAEKPLKQKDLLLNEMALGTGSNLFITRKSLNYLEGFDEKFRRHQDLEFMLRFLGKFSVLNLTGLMIVKATNGTDNVPEYKGLLEVKKLYLSKFKQVIDSLEEKEKREFLANQYNELFFSAVMSKKKQQIEKSIEDLERFRKLTAKERLFILLAGKNLSKTKLYKTLRPVYNASKDKLFSMRLNKHVDSGTKEYVYKILRGNSSTDAIQPPKTFTNQKNRRLQAK